MGWSLFNPGGDEPQHANVAAALVQVGGGLHVFEAEDAEAEEGSQQAVRRAGAVVGGLEQDQAACLEGGVDAFQVDGIADRGEG